MRLRLIAASLAAALSAPASGMGLLEAWNAALDADPGYRAARYELEAGRQALPIARSTLRPSVNITTSDTKVRGTREFGNVAPGSPAEQNLDYMSRQRALNVRMPLLNMDGRARVRQGEAQVQYSEALFDARGKDLANRLGKAYFDLLFALDSVELAQGQVDAYRGQVAFAQRRLQAGEGTRTEVAEAEARLDLAQVNLIETRDQVDVVRRALQNIVGRDTIGVVPPTRQVEPRPLEPATLEAWLAMAEDRSPEVRARRFSVEAARHEVARNRAGHYPRIDAVAAASRLQNDSVNTLNSDINQRSFGLQVTVPIYQGGYVDATTEQAIANLRRTESDLDAELNTQRVEVRRQFLAAQNGMTKLDSYAKAVRSSEVALEATRRGFQAGLRTSLDVLDAQRQLFQSRRDQAQARYQYLLAVLQLRVSAGMPPEEAVSTLNAMLTAAR
ncbi:MAG TPA: TolC family outer membrane protein [Quisquiliibacterium sp.]|nr:TolC family outer membrane protein [Quisquiliibacterium sp.]HQN14536.1 TolC family outer membrane protein [Quisquiliibacterium sp.]HQP67749.1 TolC family outer membrane protein [Quisquiliibacterium sp.]